MSRKHRHTLMSDVDMAERQNMAACELFEQLNLRFIGRPLDWATVRDMQSFIREAKISYRLRDGIRLPEMTIVALPTPRAVEVWRRDLEPTQINTKVKQLLAKWPKLPTEEIAYAIRCAYPGYRPEIARKTS